MTTIRVTVDEKTGTISILNDGAGIPVTMHTKEKIYVPELIFGNLLTSSNYDDSEQRYLIHSFQLHAMHHREH
jgi:DNA topoisomerase-2